MGIERINRRSSIIGGTGLGGRQQSPLVARGPMFAGYDIPPQEVAELYKLYTQTGGPSWIDKTNWFANKQCATWYGLTVAGGKIDQIQLQNNNLIGVSSFVIAPFSALRVLYVYSNVDFIWDLRSAGMSTKMQRITVYASKATFDFALSDLPAPFIALSNLSARGKVSGGDSPMKALAVQALAAQTTDMDAASKDSIIERLYADRALFTYAGHTLNISGGPALTGVYQASAAPSTPAEKAYALVNDPNGDGFLKWVITL